MGTLAIWVWIIQHDYISAEIDGLKQDFLEISKDIHAMMFEIENIFKNRIATLYNPNVFLCNWKTLLFILFIVIISNILT
jgi:hypothetical protein